MTLRSFSWLFLLVCVPAYAESDAIAVTVTRNVDLPPDSIYMSMAIVTEQDVTLDQVLQASQALGLTAQNLVSFNLQQYGPSPSQNRLAYAFDLSVPFSKLKETSDKLASVRRTMAANSPAMELQLYSMAVASGASARDQARDGLLAPLFQEARTRADQLAKAAGVTLGNVVAVSEGWAPAGSGNPYYGPTGPIGPSTLKTALTLNVSYAVK